MSIFLALLLLPAAVRAADPPPAKAVPPELLKGLTDEQPKVRINALKQLSKLGPEAVPSIVGALKDADAGVRQTATLALRMLRLEPAVRLAALKPYTKDDDARVRQGVVGALSKVGPDAVPLVAAALGDKEIEVRKQAVQCLQTLTQTKTVPPQAVLPGLTKATRDDSAAVRLSAVQALSKCGPDAVPVLLANLNDKDKKVRVNAIAALTGPPPDAKTMLPPLAAMLKADEDPIVRQSIMLVLARLGPDAVEPLLGVLPDKEPVVQAAALKALAKIGLGAKSALPKLKELAVKAHHPGVRAAAVDAIVKCAAEPKPALLAVLKSASDSETRLPVLQALGRTKGLPKTAVPLLVTTLQDKETDVRALSAHLLGQIGPAAKEAVPALTQALKEADETLKPVIEKALKEIGGK